MAPRLSDDSAGRGYPGPILKAQLASASVKAGMRDTYAHLMAYAQGRTNDHALACILATWWHGGGAMPTRLGLSESWFEAMLQHHFPGAVLKFPLSGSCVDERRDDELEDLRTLLLYHRAHDSASEVWVAEIISVACLAHDHLWQDLGLWQRKDLTDLMRNNFPTLAARNDLDMKWKKFLYKQLCETEGVYICRSPSCEVCLDYDACFGNEE